MGSIVFQQNINKHYIFYYKGETKGMFGVGFMVKQE